MMSGVWEIDDLPSPAVRLVLLKLADCAHDHGGGAFPSVRRLAKDCGLNPATVQRSLTWLREEGWIEVEEEARQHRPTTWRLLFDQRGQRTQNAYTENGSAYASTPSSVRIHEESSVRILSRIEPSVQEPSIEPLAAARPAHPIKALLSEHERLFVQYVGQKPHYTGKDAKLAGQLIAQHGYEAVMEMLPRLFTSLDPFIRQSGHDMAILSSCWNKLTVQAQPQAILNESTIQTIAAGERWLQRRQQRQQEALDAHK
jgi:hypothetical protein